MIQDLFSLFNSVLSGLPRQEWFLCVIASAFIFGIGLLIKFIVVKDD